MVYNGPLRGISRRRRGKRWRDEVNTEGIRMEGLVKVLGERKIIYKRKEEIWMKKEGMRRKCGKRQSTHWSLESDWMEREMTKGIWRERDGWRGDRREICVLFCYSLWSGDILGGSQRYGRAFLFVFFLDFSFSLWFLQTNCFISPSPSPSPFSSCLFPWDGNLKLSSLALLPGWK